ncbi:MAG: 50S ribosomal protein L18 [Planctomycetota bacterium]|nr:50S ribosomal protein L18 [Planctomycetota bacterium]MDA1105262.1 50S ribosomal protein L18 [Planctomycetota bacterium]
MDKNIIKSQQRARRKKGLRKRVLGTPDRPRLSVYRSLNHMYAQVIDDLAGRTLASASSRDIKDLATTGNVAAAAQVGKVIADRAKQAGFSKIVFDRNGFRYHGRVKALAAAAREGGLQF